jgi:PKD repeat protein
MTLKANSQGNFLYQWQTPNSLVLGEHNISVIAVNYAGPPSDFDTFLATQWPLSITPNTTNVVKGSTLGLNGTGFPPNALVRFYWDGVQYIKAGTADQDGNLSIDIFLNYAEDDSYHILVVNVTGSFVGPPSTFTHVWLGQNPPNLTVGSLDEDHEPRNEFYSDEAIYVTGSGYPGLTPMTVLVLDSRPVVGAPLSPLASVQVTTDLSGSFSPTLLWPSNGIGEFYLVIDVNSNSILDGIDQLMNGTLIRRRRPNVAVINVELDVYTPIQGELVTTTFVIANEGDMAINTSVALALDALTVWDGTIVGLTPGSTMTYNTTLDTGLLGLGSHNVTATAENLVDEIDTLDNSLVAQFDVLSRPDIEVISITPNSTHVVVGEILVTTLVVENNGDRPESMEVDLLVDSTVVMTQTVQRLMPGTPYSLPFAWDTTSEAPRNISLSARAKPLPLEQLTANNEITYGIITLSPPNSPPVADPNGPYAGLRGKAVLFDASGSFDLDGEIESYMWDFGDGTTGAGATVNHVYASGGSFVVTLNVTDDDGTWSTGVTVCRITIPIFWLNITIVDAVSGNPITSAEAKIDGMAYPLVDGSVSIEVESGGHRITATAIDYIQKTVDIQLTGSISLPIEMNPVCRIWPSDDKGTQMNSFSSEETVYATILSPGIYQSRVYVVSGALPADQATILDVTGDGPVNTKVGKGQTFSLVWPPDQRKGDFRLVLDLDSDGVFDSLHDRISPRFSVPEMAFLLALSSFLAIIFKLGRGSGTPVP